MRELKLSNSDKVALVDDEDYEWVAEYNWQLGTGGEVIRCTSWGRVKYNILLHRVINDTPIGFYTDHKNRNKLDNQKENLRTCTYRQNNANRPKLFKKSGDQVTSIYKGVCANKRYLKKPWTAQIRKPDGRRFIGNYATQEEAALAYNNAALKLQGEFAMLNQL